MQAPDLAPVLQRLIRQGSNAGQPRKMNDVVLDQLKALNATAIILKRNGYTMLSAQAGNGLPTIRVEAGALTEDMLKQERACYYREGKDHGMPIRWGQFAEKPNGVRVIFAERTC